MAKEKDLKSELESARAASRKSPTNENIARVKELQAQQSASLSDGAKNCKDCGNAPHGMEQAGTINNRPFTYYEVGCLVCRDHRSQGMTQEEAVKNWNAGEFLPPKG